MADPDDTGCGLGEVAASTMAGAVAAATEMLWRHDLVLIGSWRAAGPEWHVPPSGRALVVEVQQ